MRRVLLALAVLLLITPAAVAGEEQAAKEGLTPEQVARLILEGGDSQQRMIAQYLERADAATLGAIQRAVREQAKRAAGVATGPETPPKPGKGPVQLVNLEVRFLEVQIESAKDTAADFVELVEGADGDDSVGMLSPKQLDALLRFVERDEHVTQITAPRITCYDGQRANVSILNQVSYIRDYDVEVQGDEWIADPVVGVVQEGLTMDLRPVTSKDRRYVTVTASMTWADLHKPIAERKVLLEKAASPVTIQLPELHVGGTNATVTIPVGHAAVLSTPATFGNGAECVQRLAVITARPLTIEGDIQDFIGQEIDLVPSDDAPAPAVRKKLPRPAPPVAVTPLEPDAQILEDVKREPAARIDMHVLELPAAGAARHLRGLTPTMKQTVFPLTAKRAAQLLRTARRGRGMRIRDHVRATVPAGQTVVLDDTVTESYIQDYDVEVSMGGAYIADPIIAAIVDGLTLEVQARVRKSDMALSVKGAWGAVIRPIPTFETRLAEQGRTVTIQLPELRYQQVDEELTFRGEGWWLIRTRANFTNDAGRESVRAVLVHAKRTLYGQPRLYDGGDR